MPLFTWILAHGAQLSGLLGLLALAYGVRAQRASIRYSHTNARKAELDISAIPASVLMTYGSGDLGTLTNPITLLVTGVYETV